MSQQQASIRVQASEGVSVDVPVTELRHEIGAEAFDAAVTALLARRLSAASAAASAAVTGTSPRALASVKETLTPDDEAAQ